MKQKQCLSMRHPFFYAISVFVKRHNRYCDWLFGKGKYSKETSQDLLPSVITKHKSLLVRKLGDSDIQLQINKKKNLTLAIKKINNIIIRPGERFSFWRLVGNTTKSKGYLEGLEIYRGKITSGIGGGVCQLSNMIYWMAIHTDLDVAERHTHAFDAFPDNNRTIPFGRGATVSYNYYDLVLENNTQRTYQLHFWMTDEFVYGQIRSDTLEPHKHHIAERNHRFHLIDGQYYRENELWRQTHDPATGNLVADVLVVKNFSEVKYTPEVYSMQA